MPVFSNEDADLQCMVELLAVVAAIETFKDHHQRKLVLILSNQIFVDSEPIEAALIKGCSAKEDVCGNLLGPCAQTEIFGVHRSGSHCFESG